MTARLIIEDVVEVPNVSTFAVVLGTVFTIKLGGLPPGLPVSWSADNDEVLSIDDDNLAVAEITATSLGRSTIDLKNRGRLLGSIVVTVFRDTATEAVRFDSEVGPEVDK